MNLFSFSRAAAIPGGICRREGFTLIEIVVSIGIIGAMLILFQAVLSGSNLSSYAKNQGLARGIAETKLEALRLGGYSALPASGSFTTSDLSLLPGGTGVVTVSNYNASVKQVTVTVSWVGHQSPTPYSLSLDTLITTTGGLP